MLKWVLQKSCTRIAQNFQKETHFYPMSSHEQQPAFDFFLLHPVAVDCTHGYSACLCGDEDEEDDDDDAAVCVCLLV